MPFRQTVRRGRYQGWRVVFASLSPDLIWVLTIVGGIVSTESRKSSFAVVARACLRYLVPT